MSKHVNQLSSHVQVKGSTVSIEYRDGAISYYNADSIVSLCLPNYLELARVTSTSEAALVDAITCARRVLQERDMMRGSRTWKRYVADVDAQLLAYIRPLDEALDDAFRAELSVVRGKRQLEDVIERIVQVLVLLFVSHARKADEVLIEAIETKRPDLFVQMQDGAFIINHKSGVADEFVLSSYEEALAWYENAVEETIEEEEEQEETMTTTAIEASTFEPVGDGASASTVKVVIEYTVRLNVHGIGGGYCWTAESDEYIVHANSKAEAIAEFDKAVRFELEHSNYELRNVSDKPELIEEAGEETMTTQDIINTINKAAPSYSDETIHVRLFGVADGWDFHIDAKEYAEEGGLQGWLNVYTELDPETVAEITNHDWMFVDWEGALVSHCISEWSFDCDQYKELVESELDPEILEAGLECGIPLEHIADAYAGSYESDEEYAQSLAEDCGDIPEHLWNYIDWERYARDVCMDMHSSNGHYFYMNW